MEDNRTSPIPDKWHSLVERLEQLIISHPTGVTLVFIDNSTTVVRDSFNTSQTVKGSHNQVGIDSDIRNKRTHIHQHGTGNTNKVNIDSTLTTPTK